MPDASQMKTPQGHFRGRKFLIVLGTFRHLGGAERQAVLLGKFLKRTIGAEVVFLGSSGGDLVEGMLRASGIPFVISPFPEGVSRTKRLWNMWNLVMLLRRRVRPEFIIPFISYNSKIMGLIWRLTGAKYALWNQRDEGRGVTGSRVERFAISQVSDIVSNSYAGRDALVEKLGVSPERVRIINNGVEPHRPSSTAGSWRTRFGIDAGARIVTMVATVGRFKDHRTLIEAWSSVHRRLNAGSVRAVLLLAGSLNESACELKALAFDLGLCASIRFVGRVEGVGGLLAETDLAVHSSDNEGCPNAVLEAMAASLAVVGTDIPGIRQALGQEYLRHCLVPPRNPDQLAECILALLENPGLREEIGHYNRERIESEFSVKQMGYAYLSLIAEHLERESP